MIATNIEQSQHLIKLVLDPKTADMCWVKDYTGQWVLITDTQINIRSRLEGMYEYSGFQWQEHIALVPSWSLSALLEVIPAMIVYPTWGDKRTTDVWFNLDKDYNRETKKQFYMCYYKSLDTHQLAKNTDPTHTSPIDAAYEMVCWLLENNLIKKGEKDG